MLHATNASRFFQAHEATPEKPRVPIRIPKMTDDLHRFHGSFDRGQRGVCSLRVFEEPGQTSVIVVAELPAAELIQRHFPRRFDHEPPAILLEHYPREPHTSGRTAMQPTWDRPTCHSWAPRRVWLGGQARLAFGEPEWRSLPEHEVAALLGRAEMLAPPPQVRPADDQP